METETLSSSPEMPHPTQIKMRLGVATFAFFILAYTVVFILSNNISLVSAIVAAFINTATLAFWSSLTLAILHHSLITLSPLLQVPLHLVLSIAFSVLWYFSITVIFGWKSGNFLGAFSVEPFSTVAFIWQFFQGLIVYGGLVSTVYAWRFWTALKSKPSPSAPQISKLMVREEDEILAIPIDQIICVSGAGDYSEIITPQKRYLTRKRLNELSEVLPPCFLRVHRSHLINIDKMSKAESIGGGRLRIYQQNNITVDSSRAGSRLLREHAN